MTRPTEPAPSPAASQPRAVMAIDVGAKRIGLAISDPTRAYALPLATVEVDPARRDRATAAIIALGVERGVGHVVIGWPLTLQGKRGPATARVEAFEALLRPHLKRLSLDWTITRWDERMTTATAEAMLIGADVSRAKRKQVIDQLAAAHILDGFLASERAASAPA